jgi:hypothetical protein
MPHRRAMLGAFFIVGYNTSVVSLAVAGLFGSAELLLGVALIPGAVIGYLVAPAIAPFINAPSSGR